MAAAKAGDVASILVPPPLLRAALPLQAEGIAVLVDGDKALATECDGLQVGGGSQVGALRKTLPGDAIIGALCGASRHAAMQAGEDGADYVALTQSGFVADEPVIRWWSALFEIPCVAYEPTSPDALDILLPQNPDFIRPLEAMWISAAEAQRIVSELTQALKET